jgi:hypothetical protein
VRVIEREFCVTVVEVGVAAGARVKLVPPAAVSVTFNESPAPMPSERIESFAL